MQTVLSLFESTGYFVRSPFKFACVWSSSRDSLSLVIGNRAGGGSKIDLKSVPVPAASFPFYSEFFRFSLFFLPS
jgi:hypothetical protein